MWKTLAKARNALGIRRELERGHQSEINHWAEVESSARAGERLFWLNHPRVAKHYYDKAMIGGLPWRRWLPGALGRTANIGLELGCGNGAGIVDTWRNGTAASLIGLDLDESRFVGVKELPEPDRSRISFMAADVNELRLEESRYDLIYAVQSFHHFQNLEGIMQQVRQALKPDGFFVLDEYVGPRRFQWTDLQLSLVHQFLGLMPVHLRRYRSGIEKACEGRSTVDEVIEVCPSEAIRSDEIVPVFYHHFNVVTHQNLGGTIQHLLYSGIIQNFPDGDAAIDQMIDCVDGLETTLINGKVIPSDFVLLIGQR